MDAVDYMKVKNQTDGTIGQAQETNYMFGELVSCGIKY